MDQLIGMGLYTPAEAGRLLHIPSARISRWLRGHQAGERHYPPLWLPQVQLEDGRVCLGFRDLMEVRIADAFIRRGVPAQRIRAAIQLAKEVYGADRPLSTNRFQTDGRDIFLRVVDEDEHGEERERLLNLFRQQYEFKQIIGPVLKTIDFDGGGEPFQWWPQGHRAKIVVDPARAFGQPIDEVSSVPTVILAAAGRLDGISCAARAYDVPISSVKRAIDFEETMERRAAA